MGTIIVLQGKAHTGKTTTIKRAIEQIFSIYYYRPKKDAVFSFKFRDKIIAIITLGDVPKEVENFYNKIGKFDILICSCRSQGKTLEFYMGKKSEHEVIFIQKTIPTNAQQEEIIFQIKEIISV